MIKTVFSFLLVSLFLAVFTGCTGPELTGPENTTTFELAGRIKIEEPGDGTYRVTFKDATDNWVTASGNADSSLYARDGISVQVTAEGFVLLTDSRTGTVDTLTVYRDYSAEEQLVSATAYDIVYYLADGTGTVRYTGNLVRGPSNRIMSVVFQDTSGDPAGSPAAVSQTYLADSRKTLSWSNPFYSVGIGPAGRTSITPAAHAGVVAVLLSIPQMDVFLETNGDYIVDYYDTSGTLLAGSSVTPDETVHDLYPAGGADNLVQVLADNTVLWSLRDGAGYHQYLVNVNGLTVEMDSSSGARELFLHFMDQNSGLFKYNAALQQTGVSTYVCHFTDLSTPDIQFQYSVNMDESMGIFDNFSPITNPATINGQVHFETEHYPGGNVRELFLLNCRYEHDT